ncbi:hypothetical protein OIU76_019777 [Salix suchowensis]|nr:hypothetical protein OIU76_019777 [Salix suchowensis]
MVVKEIVVINACNRLWLKQRALASSKSKSDVTPCMLIVIYIIFCEQQDQGRPLPKFGEWDVNNPASAEGFTVIFSKARDEKKSGTASGAGAASQRKTNSSQANTEEMVLLFLRPVVALGGNQIVQFDPRAMEVLF